MLSPTTFRPPLFTLRNVLKIVTLNLEWSILFDNNLIVNASDGTPGTFRRACVCVVYGRSAEEVSARSGLGCARERESFGFPTGPRVWLLMLLSMETRSLRVCVCERTPARVVGGVTCRACQKLDVNLFKTGPIPHSFSFYWPKMTIGWVHNYTGRQLCRAFGGVIKPLFLM